MIWHRYLALFAIALGTLVVPMDSSVNIAFPYITAAFDIEIAAIQWVVISYVLTHFSLMLLFGKLGDLFGYKLIFQAGLGVSGVAFVLCATATAFGWLLAARVSQGLGAALVVSCGPALVISYFQESQRGKALGFYTSIFGIGAVLGPTLGGVMVSAWGWTSVFWFRAPVCLLALVLIWCVPAPSKVTSSGSFDLLGAILLVLTLSGLFLTLNQSQNSNMPLLGVLGIGAVVALLFVSFAFHESRAVTPIVRVSIFRDVDFSLQNLANIVINMVGFSIMLLVPFFLANATEYSTMTSGLILATAPLGMACAGPLAGWALAHVPGNRLALLAVFLIVTGLSMIASWDQQTGIVFITFGLLLQGMGMGVFQVAYSHIVTGVLPRSERGIAGSLAMVTRSGGVVTGATVLSWMFANALAAGGEFVDAFQTTFRHAALLCAGFFFLTLLRPRIWFGKRE
jgi:MFS family permease